MVSLFKNLSQLVTGVRQFSQAIAGTAKDPVVEEVHPLPGRKNRAVSDGGVDFQDTKPTALERGSGGAGGDDGHLEEGPVVLTTMTKTLQACYPESDFSEKTLAGRPSEGSVTFAPSATSSWSSVGSTSSERAAVLGLKDAVVELDHYDYAGIIGRGHFSSVILLKQRETSGLFALKVIRRKKPKTWYTESREQLVHAMLDHPFICPLLHSFVTYEERCYVLPYAAGGSLREILRENGKLSPEFIRFYLCEIVSAIIYLHELGITYHDLKPENILVDQTGHVLLCDFGLSSRNTEALTGAGRGFRGTPKYVAPEIVLRRDHGYVVDCWSLGILIYELYVGRVPFRANSRRELFQKICGAPLKYPGDDRNRRSRVDSWNEGTQLSINERDGHRQTNRRNSGVTDDVVEAVRGLISGLLTRNPVNRFLIDDVRNHSYFGGVDWEQVYNGALKVPT